MFGIGLPEIAVILVVALLVFGPDRVPEMTRQAASFVRDLRTMVANARRDINVSVADLGIDEEDLRTLRQLRNPKTFVRDKVLDGVELDDLGLDDLGLDEQDDKGKVKRNGGGRKDAAAPRPAATSDSDSSSDRVAYDPDTT